MERHIKQVESFHELAGHPVQSDGDLKALTPERALSRADWMREEIMEFTGACAVGDIPGAFDAIGDLLYFAFGTVVEMGGRSKMATFFEIIHRANMSKFCPDEDTAQRTVLNYASTGIRTHYLAQDAFDGKGTYYVVYYSEGEKAGKVAKSIDWQEPDYSRYFTKDGKQIQ